MAELASVGHDYFGFDSVAPYFSIHLESSALGDQIDWGDSNSTPRVIRNVAKKLDDLSVPSDFIDRQEFQMLIMACGILHKKYKGSVAVIGKVIGPWTLAYHLYGVENMILDTILEPEKTKQVIKELAQIPLKFAKRQFEAGADIITWAEHCTSDLVSAEIYRDFVAPIHRDAVAKLQRYGPLVLHTCGNIMDRLDYIADTGICMLHIDSRNDIAKAVEQIGDRVVLTGSSNNPFTLSQDRPSDVCKEVRYNIKCGIKLISPECAIPCNVTDENLFALVETAHQQKYAS